jgi:hypothetical protein
MDLEESTEIKPDDFARLAEFFRERVRESSVTDGDALLYQGYVKMFSNGMRRTMPCPSTDQGLLLNPNGDLFYCENSYKIGNVREDDPAACYYDPRNLAGRREILKKICPTCASPCFVNAAAMKQVFPYLRFLVELGGEKVAAKLGG